MTRHDELARAIRDAIDDVKGLDDLLASAERSAANHPESTRLRESLEALQQAKAEVAA